MKNILQEKLLENVRDDDNNIDEDFDKVLSIVEKRKCKKTVKKCKKLRTFIKSLVGRNIIVLLNK